MERLTRSTPTDLPVKVLAIGAGGFHRAVTHEFIDELNKRGLYRGGVFVGQPRGTEKAEAFNQQGGLYHVAVFDTGGLRDVKLIESVVGATTLATPEGREAFYAHTASELDLILVGVTEAGIAKGQVAMGVLDETLYRYFRQHGKNSTICVINTDNIRNNGQVIRNILCKEYPQRAAEYADWLRNNVGFLDEMGDRLVPQVVAVPEELKAEALRCIGKQDALMTYTEQMPSVPLVIRDERHLLRVPFHALSDLGVIVTPDSIEPHHDWKLLLINSVHIPGITHKGMLSGIEFVNDAANHPLFGPHLERLMAGYAKIVEADIPLPGRSAHAYTMEFVERIRHLKDTNARINIIETIKLRERAADIIKSPHYQEASEQFKEDFAYSVATVLRFLTPYETRGSGSGVRDSGREPRTPNPEPRSFTGITDIGTTYEIRDNNRTIQNRLTGAFDADEADARNRLTQIFSDSDLWTPPGASERVDLSRNRDFMERVGRYYHRLVNGETCLEVLRQGLGARD